LVETVRDSISIKEKRREKASLNFGGTSFLRFSFIETPSVET
jgi:hypothetical protein